MEKAAPLADPVAAIITEDRHARESAGAPDRLRPAVQVEGGHSEFVEGEGGVVKLMLQRVCVGCPSSRTTLKMEVEELAMDDIPEVREVVAL